MRLTLKNIHTYLLDKGYLDIQSLVSGDYMVVQHQTRNTIFKVLRKNQKGLFVKQLNSFNIHNAYVFQKDATCQQLIKTNPAYQELSPHVPEFLGFDVEKQILVSEYIADSVTFRQSFPDGIIPESIVTMLSGLLASYHLCITEELSLNKAIGFLPRQIPWILRLNEMDQPEIQLLYSQSAGINPILTNLLANKEVKEQLTVLKNSWEYKTLIHGDLKWDNILLHRKADKAHIMLIDWEISDIGDPLWDVSGIFQSFFVDTLQQTLPGKDLNSFAGIDIQDLSSAFSKIRLFWSAYLERTSGLSSHHNNTEKTLRYSGARLFQSAIEYYIIGPTHHSFAARLLLAGQFILNNAAQLKGHIE